MSRPIEFPAAGLSDGVVRVRVIADADLAGIADACADPLIARYTTVPQPYDERHAREWQRRSESGIAAGTDIAVVVVGADAGELLGSVGLHGIDPASGRCSAGYWVAAGARGGGVAARAMRLLCRYAFDELAVSRVEIWVEPENLASQRVAQRVGFAREGLLRSFMPIKGVRRDMLMYSLLPADLS